MEVEIISSQFIKPSFPTTHPKSHKLSILDQYMPPAYIPMLLFYSIDQNTQAIVDIITQKRMKQLKESLSQTLNLFYPFAGRIKDKVTIDCNDEGVHFTEAKVSCSLVEFFNQPNLSSLIYKLLPKQAVIGVSAEGYITMAQVTCFACGGIVIGTLISHMVADGAGASFFLNSWGSNSHINEFQHAFEFPNFDTPFPRNNACPQDKNAMHLCCQTLKEGRLTTRRFLFDEEAISRLRGQGSSSTVQNPTRVEVVASLLCKCAAKASKAKSGLERPTLVIHSINMRRRASPNFPNSCMGNFVWLAMALMSANDELPELVTKLRETVTSIDHDFVKRFQDEGGFVNFCESLKQVMETTSRVAMGTGVNYLRFTSWCNFGLYDVDFGWGKPIWVSCFADSVDDLVILMDTPSRKGIEAWIYLNEDKMALLQQDNELLMFATMDPNPLRLKDYVSHA
ncbi:stemmadenine O-acetyltransferase [Cajanus cajan]|uniref:Vinorine synthase n=1 Tax=Cajanus cajan TaxID=3821 RepID=A0A151U345_CAJCA|nr:stemmadenine O-acetyltransferase [Cajanus cajan]KYP73749.1 Vinorine synthase [Cajanus cajan]